MVSNHTPRVYATVTAHVNRDLSPRLCIRMLKGPAAAQRGPALIAHNNKNQFAAACRQLTQWPPHTGWRQAREWKTEKARNAPKGKKSMTVSGNRRQMDPFIGCCLSLLCQFLFLKSYLCEFLFIRKHVFVYTRCRAQGVDDLKINLHSSG